MAVTRPEPVLPQARPMEVILVAPWRPPAVPPPRRDARASAVPRGPAKTPVPAAVRSAPSAPVLGDWRVKPEQGAVQEPARKALRALARCEGQAVLALTREERQACADKLGAGARDAPTYAVVSPKLKKQFDGVYECPPDDAWCEYRMGKAPYPGLFAPHGRKKKYREWD